MHLTYLQSGSKKRQTETKAQSRGPKPGRSREPQQEAEAGAEARERNRGPTPPGTAGRRPGPGDQGPREFGSLRSHFQSIILLNKEAQLCVYRTETKVQQNKTTVSPSARKHRNNTGSSPRGRAAGPSSRQQQPMPEYCRRRETHWMSPLDIHFTHNNIKEYFNPFSKDGRMVEPSLCCRRTEQRREAPAEEEDEVPDYLCVRI